MASATTLNSWMEQLALSLIPPTAKSADSRRLKDNFTRKIRHHPYGRTNQFDVAERLIGLEEKLQVLNLDDEAEALYARRQELNQRDVRWVPDALDLLLHLSQDPVTNTRVELLDRFQARIQTPPPLKWADVEADDPIDHQDQIWRIPEYSDFSSDEDEIHVSSTDTSPGVRISWESGKAAERIFEQKEADEHLTSPSKQHAAAQFWRGSSQVVSVTERQAVREVLFMLLGLPSSIFISDAHGIRPSPRFRLSHLGNGPSRLFLQEAAVFGSEIQSTRQWLQIRQDVHVMQAAHDNIRDILAAFEREVSQVQDDILHEHSHTKVLSLLQVLRTVKDKGKPLKAIAATTTHLGPNDTITTLNTLYESLNLAYASGDRVASETLFPIFLSAMRFYARPVDVWLRTGTISSSEPFFISETKQPRDGATLWHHWFLMSDEDGVVPSFLKKFTERIFAAGKTAAFLRQLGHNTFLDTDNGNDDDSIGLESAVVAAAQLTHGSPIPFSATFEMIFDQHLTSLLSTSTAALKGMLETKCGMTKLFDAIEYLYLGKDGVILDNVEGAMFDQIDRCVETWNDRFLVADSLAEAYAGVGCVDPDSITVQSSRYASSRSMESRRRSVKILGDVTVSYHLTWAIANVVLPVSMVSYQRIALTLGQARRAKSILARRAYLDVQNTPLGTENDQKLGQAIHSAMAYFVNVLYAHLTTCTVGPLTRAMRSSLGAAATTGSVDEMIAVHTRYVRNLEHACLSSKRVKPLRDALLAVLDLCIRFADVVAASSASMGRRSSSGDADFEASSFISARSQRRRRRRRRLTNTEEGASSSSSDYDDDNENGEGYSTFILDKDTSVMQEIRKIRDTFAKHVLFLVAGLRAVARSSGEVGDGMELLADTLEGVFPRKKNAF
jgi:gamma-tubulin complex component 5